MLSQASFSREEEDERARKTKELEKIDWENTLHRTRQDSQGKEGIRQEGTGHVAMDLKEKIYKDGKNGEMSADHGDRFINYTDAGLPDQ